MNQEKQNFFFKVIFSCCCLLVLFLSFDFLAKFTREVFVANTLKRELIAHRIFLSLSRLDLTTTTYLHGFWSRNAFLLAHQLLRKDSKARFQKICKEQLLRNHKP